MEFELWSILRPQCGQKQLQTSHHSSIRLSLSSFGSDNDGWVHRRKYSKEFLFSLLHTQFHLQPSWLKKLPKIAKSDSHWGIYLRIFFDAEGRVVAQYVGSATLSKGRDYKGSWLTGTQRNNGIKRYPASKARRSE